MAEFPLGEKGSRDKKRAWIDAPGSRCFMAIRGYSRRSPPSLALSIRFRSVFAMLVLTAKPSVTALSLARG